MFTIFLDSWKGFDCYWYFNNMMIVLSIIIKTVLILVALEQKFHANLRNREIRSCYWGLLVEPSEWEREKKKYCRLIYLQETKDINKETCNQSYLWSIFLTPPFFFPLQCQAIVVGFLASVAAVVMGWIPEGLFDIIHALLLCASALVTASLASFILGKETKGWGGIAGLVGLWVCHGFSGF